MLNNEKFTAEKIIAKISKFEYISFDIFDTLIKRSVAKPRDIFPIVANDYIKKYKKEIDPLEFRSERIRAAHKAKEEAVNIGKEEITLDEIYNNFSAKFSGMINELKQLEILREIECCRENPIIKEVYNWCIDNDKKIFIVSDMYLPQSVIEEILCKNGYSKYEKLYLSSNIRLKKSTGKLYEYLIKELNIKTDLLVHIGDNFRIDYLQARKKGIKAIKIANFVRGNKFLRKGYLSMRDEQYKRYMQVIGNFVFQTRSDYYQYGFECVGPLLYGFCTWLHESAISRGCEKLFFLSRDGYLMQRAYQMLYEDDSIPNSYMYVSRKSLFEAQVWMKPCLEDILSQESSYHYWDINELCELLNIEIDLGKSLWKKSGLDIEERINKGDLITDKRVATFFQAIKEDLIEKSQKKFDVVVEYLQQEGFKGNVAIVDVGWAGAIQRYLQRILENTDLKCDLFGYYLGFKPETVTGPNAISYIPKCERPSLFCSQLMEYPFTKRVGSTRTYQRNENGQVVPMLEPYEFKGLEDELFTKEIQEGAIQFVEMMKIGYGAEKVDYKVAYHNIKNVTKKPRCKDVELLGKLSHVNHGRCTELANPKRWMVYVRNPRKFKLDFSDSGWKIGFLKKIFKISLPFDQILFAIRK